MKQLQAGIYRHYKGHFYQVIGFGHDANYEDRTTVIYIGLQLMDAHTGPRFATRTAESDDPNVDAWFDSVHADGSKCIHSDRNALFADINCPGKQPRFAYYGPGWNP